MKQLFTLSKKDINLSMHEVLRLYKPKEFKLIGDILIIDSSNDYSPRLAYTKEVYEVLFECTDTDLEEKTGNFDWNSVYTDSFSVRFIGGSRDERKIAGMVFHLLKTPKVDLKNAKTKIVFFKTEKKIICGLLKHENDNSYLKRKANFRPEFHPTSLHPQLAKAAINLTGKTKGSLLDPFCGAGGILTEAAIIGFKITGYDIDRIMINRSRINLEHFGVKDYELKAFDATKINEKFDCIVTDLPYGRNSKLSDEITSLYTKFLDSAYRSTDAAVILFPDFVDYKKVLGKWKVKMVFSHYLHKSLSKKIVVLEK